MVYRKQVTGNTKKKKYEKMNVVYGEQRVEVQRKYENVNVVHKSEENGEK
jgi:hypothetical protein